MTNVWSVVISLVTKSNFGLVSSQISSQAKAMEGQVAGSSQKMSRSLGGVATAAKTLNIALVGVGVLAGAAMLRGVTQAAKLETAMVSIRNATNATAAQMDMLRGKAFNVSAATAQSVVDSANVMKVMATSGINDPRKLAQIAMPASMFADVQFLSRGVPFEEGAKQAIQIAHLFQRYDPKALQPIFGQLTALSQMMPDNLNRFVTQAGYYMPLFRRLGVSDSDSLVMGAFLDRMGLGRGKGGTGLQNFLMQQIQPLQLTSHAQKGRRDALTDLGLIGPDGSPAFYNNGKFDIIGALSQIDKVVQQRTAHLTGHERDKTNTELVAEIQKALGTQGGRIGFLGTPEAVAQLHQMLEQLARFGDPKTIVQRLQARYMDTLAGQFQLFQTNFDSFLTDTMWPWLGTLKSVFHTLADDMHNLQGWVHTHRDDTKHIVELGLAAVAYAGVQIGILAVRMSMSIAGVSGSLNRLSLAISELGLASGRAAPKIGAAGVATAAEGTAAAAAAGEISGAGKVLGTLGLAARGAAGGLSTFLGVLGDIAILIGGTTSFAPVDTDPKTGKRSFVGPGGKRVQVKEGAPLINWSNVFGGGTNTSGALSGGGNVPLTVPHLPKPRGHADGGETSGTGWGLLHPNEIIVKSRTVALIEDFFARGGAAGRGGAPMIVNVTIEAPKDVDPVTARRNAKIQAEEAGSKMLALATKAQRFGLNISGRSVNPAGASVLESGAFSAA